MIRKFDGINTAATVFETIKYIAKPRYCPPDKTKRRFGSIPYNHDDCLKIRSPQRALGALGSPPFAPPYGMFLG